MESSTFKTRVLALIQKSRRALRLYNNADVGAQSQSSEGASLQVSEWREVNSTLLRKLTEACDLPTTKGMVHTVFTLRNEFQDFWRSNETEMVVSQRELISCAERGDFVRASTLSCELIRLKARVQAGQAAHHELNTLIRKGRVMKPQSNDDADTGDLISAIHLIDSQVTEERYEDPMLRQKVAIGGGGNVIPLKRRS